MLARKVQRRPVADNCVRRLAPASVSMTTLAPDCIAALLGEPGGETTDAVPGYFGRAAVGVQQARPRAVRV